MGKQMAMVAAMLCLCGLGNAETGIERSASVSGLDCHARDLLALHLGAGHPLMGLLVARSPACPGTALESSR